MKSITGQKLLEAGYKRYDRSAIDPIEVKGVFQKKIHVDYWISIKLWKFNELNGPLKETWEIDVQFTTHDGEAVNMSLVQWFNNSINKYGKTIEDVESFYETMWNTGLFSKYD